VTTLFYSQKQIDFVLKRFAIHFNILKELLIYSLSFESQSSTLMLFNQLCFNLPLSHLAGAKVNDFHIQVKYFKKIFT